MKTKKDGLLLRAASILLIGVVIMTLFSGCFGKRYKVDYSGDMKYYKGAKSAYRAGEKVVLYYDLIATDTEYKFYLDGELLNHGYDEEKGFVISFTMPDHDVVLRCTTKNIMIEDQ